ncbi:MAG: hypothetical protein WA880_11195 [Ornithinimicrobium sp.]
MPILAPASRAIPLAVAVALLAGCGSDDPEVTAAAPTTSEAADEPSVTEPEAATATPTEADSALVAQEVALESSVFWGPHRFDLGIATLEPADGGGYLRVDVVAQNLSEETFDPYGGDVWLSRDGLAGGYSADNLDSTPPKAKVAGDLEWFVDNDFDMESAVLHFGELTNNYSTVPLNGDPVTTQESVQVSPPEAASNEMWEITPSAATLYPQDVWNGYPVEQGEAFLVIDMVGTLTEKDTRSLNLSSGDFALTLPDGTTATIPGGSYPGINEVVEAGQSTGEVSLAFTVPLEAPGDYMLTHQSGDLEPIQMPFSIE